LSVIERGKKEYPERPLALGLLKKRGKTQYNSRIGKGQNSNVEKDSEEDQDRFRFVDPYK